MICSHLLHDAVTVAQVLRSELLLPLLRDPEVLPRLAPYLVRISKTPLPLRALQVLRPWRRGTCLLNAAHTQSQCNTPLLCMAFSFAQVLCIAGRHVLPAES